MERPKDLFEYERRALQVLPQLVWDMIHDGYEDEVATRRIRGVFEGISLKPRAFREGGSPNLRTTILGEDVASPVLPAVPGLKFFAHPEGEIAAARAASAAGTIAIIPHISDYECPLEDVAAATAGPKWLQVYVLRDRDLSKAMVVRAEAAGCSAIVLTVSSPLAPRYAAMVGKGRNGFRESAPQMSHGVAMPPAEFSFDPTADWSVLDWIRSLTDLPIVVKGVVTPEDAVMAVENGAAGVWLSTHASRLFDGAVLPIEILADVARAVGDRADIYLDGGVRTGADVFKAIALGASACLIGKPLFYGLAVGGEEGMAHLFSLLSDELEKVMTLCGVSSVADIDQSFVESRQLVEFIGQGRGG